MSPPCGFLFFVLLMALQMLMQTTVSECKPAPEPKPGFLGSVIGGAAGSVIGKMIKGRKSEKPQQNYYQTTIERRETFANGCYKQLVKQPDTYVHGRWTETEQLVCPPNVPPPASVPGVMPLNMPSYQAPIPGINPQEQVYVLSTRTYMDGRSNGNTLFQHSFLAIIAWALLFYFR